MKIKRTLYILSLLLFISITSCSDSKSTNLKIEKANVVITLSTDNENSIVDAIITLTNNNGNPELVYEQSTNSNNVNFTDVVYGIYTLLVISTGYDQFTNNNFSVNTALVNVQITLVEEQPEEKANVVITIVAENGGSVVGAVVTLTNNNGNPDHVYEQLADSSNINFTDVVFGVYTLIVEHASNGSYTNINFSVQSALVSQSVTLIISYEIGDLGPAGGYIFYDKGYYSDGWRFLEASPANSEFNADWGAWDIISGNYVWYDVEGTETSIGTGKSNTRLIVDMLNELGQTDKSSQICDSMIVNDFSDWFLPSKDELNLMYHTLHLHGIGHFGQGSGIDPWMNWDYCSSSQSDINHIWGHSFDTGIQTFYGKHSYSRIRAIRSF